MLLQHLKKEVKSVELFIQELKVNVSGLHEEMEAHQKRVNGKLRWFMLSLQELFLHLSK